MIWEILFILLLILINGLFAAAETSLIAARELGMHSIGIEIAPEHFHAAQERCNV